ncbi:MAG: PH domain-containing protein [Candidatus Sungbacteria bacterium]|nr:PH domain-containing protein [Candidatus Sungbacteria bacterium]
MIQLHENEHMVLLLHKHWFVVARTVLGIVFLIILLAAALLLLPFLTDRLDPDLASAATGLGLAIYLMMVALFAFFSWMDYYLDMWIVTEKRIIDVEQRGLFSREVSEIPIASVQDVTVEVHGIVQTMLGFGTIKIQTAGEREFTIDEIPHLAAVKDAILNYAHQQFEATQKTTI